MSDLPARLRALHHEFGQSHDVLIEAADRIEELEGALARAAVRLDSILTEAVRRQHQSPSGWDLP